MIQLLYVFISASWIFIFRTMVKSDFYPRTKILGQKLTVEFKLVIPVFVLLYIIVTGIIIIQTNQHIFYGSLSVITLLYFLYFYYKPGWLLKLIAQLKGETKNKNKSIYPDKEAEVLIGNLKKTIRIQNNREQLDLKKLLLSNPHIISVNFLPPDKLKEKSNQQTISIKYLKGDGIPESFEDQIIHLNIIETSLQQ